MLKKLLAAVIWFFLFQNGICQNPLVKQWDKRFGGTSDDKLYSLQQTADGGYILGGASHSGISGNKTQATWGLDDYWIVKINSLGTKQWDKDFGGTSQDLLYSLQQTSDGGYILGGKSFSGMSGDKTQPKWGLNDYWIVKIDSLGNKQWDKDFGGVNDDHLYSLQQTADGGYILGGYSQSGISGDKTQTTWGSWDYWIVKTDSLGNKQWDKDFGGTDYDYLYSIQQTADGGYILGGHSNSGISGDKTQPNWDTATIPTYDYWIIKIDSLGNKQWDKVFGGTTYDWFYSLKQTADGGYILAGTSSSQISGDKTQNTWGQSYDYWIVKTDSFGNKQWDKDFGGFNEEWDPWLYSLYGSIFQGNISQTTDGGYLFAGTSYSLIGGDKTQNNLGDNQSWIVKTDSLGNKQWDRTLLTNSTSYPFEKMGLAIQTEDGCFAMANYTRAGIGGDKTQPRWNNSYDYWIIKFCDSTLTTSIQSEIKNPQSEIYISPNPATDKINISFPATASENITVKIYSVTGEVVYEKLFQSFRTLEKLNAAIDITGFSNGIYFLSVHTGKEAITKKIIVNH